MVSVGSLILAAISFMCALILDAMLRFQNEARMLAYIQSSGPDVQKIKPGMRQTDSHRAALNRHIVSVKNFPKTTDLETKVI